MARISWVLLVSLKWTLGIVSVLVLLAVAINAIDEDLTPEAKALRVAPPNPYKPEDNLYLALLGIEAPQGISPIAVGQARVVAHEKEVAAALRDPRYVFPDLFGSKEDKLTFQGKAEFCQPLRKSCWADVETHKAAIVSLLKANQELYQRYSRLHEHTGFYETATPSIHVLIAYPPPAMRQLYLANIALQTKTGTFRQQEAALADLHKDIRTWRVMLVGNGGLITKMVAVANLLGDYAMLADIIADRRIDLSSHSTAIRAMLDAPVQDDWKIGDVFAHEYRFSLFLWEQMRAARALGVWRSDHPSRQDLEWWEPYLEMLQYPFLKLNATENLHASLMVRLQKVANADPERFFSARDAHEDWVREIFNWGPHFVYNPFGKTMVAAGANAYEEYPLRAFDAAAFHRVVRLAYEIRSRKIDGKAIPSFMQQHPQWATHPVDGKPFLWDDKKNELAVQPLAKSNKDRRFAIPVWTAGSKNK